MGVKHPAYVLTDGDVLTFDVSGASGASVGASGPKVVWEMASAAAYTACDFTDASTSSITLLLVLLPARYYRMAF